MGYLIARSRDAARMWARHTGARKAATPEQLDMTITILAGQFPKNVKVN